MNHSCEHGHENRVHGNAVALACAAGIALLLGGCITVKAPDKPIEINLNVKVQQEVVVRLQKDAQDLIENNPELFPE